MNQVKKIYSKSVLAIYYNYFKPHWHVCDCDKKKGMKKDSDMAAEPAVPVTLVPRTPIQRCLYLSHIFYKLVIMIWMW